MSLRTRRWIANAIHSSQGRIVAEAEIISAVKKYDEANQHNRNSHDKWAKSVLIRDGRRCKMCGVRERLHAHHIFPRRKFPRLRYNIDNGITLCQPCHMKWHALKRAEAKRRG